MDATVNYCLVEMQSLRKVYTEYDIENAAKVGVFFFAPAKYSIRHW